MRVNERLEDAPTNAMEKQTKRKCEKRKRAREKRSEEKGRINKERKEKKEQGALLHRGSLIRFIIISSDATFLLCHHTNWA